MTEFPWKRRSSFAQLKSQAKKTFERYSGEGLDSLELIQEVVLDERSYVAISVEFELN